jgi:hypothetical protein
MLSKDFVFPTGDDGCRITSGQRHAVSYTTRRA